MATARTSPKPTPVGTPVGSAAKRDPLASRPVPSKAAIDSSFDSDNGGPVDDPYRHPNQFNTSTHLEALRNQVETYNQLVVVLENRLSKVLSHAEDGGPSVVSNIEPPACELAEEVFRMSSMMASLNLYLEGVLSRIAI